MIQHAGEDIFEVTTDRFEVTSNHRPDTNWIAVDHAGHEHRWHVDGIPAASYSPTAKYDTPTLIVILDGIGYWEDGEPYDITHRECRQCGEHIEPGYTADTCRQYIPGIRHYRINEKSVSQEEFQQRWEAAHG